jgi:predicted AlkP superfamily phosphohydrolase/phosphomutase
MPTLFCLFMLSGCEEGSDRAPVVMVGIDGAEWSVIESMIAEGELPNFRRFRDEFSWGRLINPGPTTSPIVWTTFASGHFGRQHGILDHVYPYGEEAGKRPVSSELRQVPAIWNIADYYGLRSTVVGYFVTHPPEQINGVMVSPLAPQYVEGAIWPEDAIDTRQDKFTELHNEDVRKALNSRYFGFDYEREHRDNPDASFQASAEIVGVRNLDQRIFKDEFLRRAANELFEQPSDLHINYYRLVDFMSHSLWYHYDHSDFETVPDPVLQQHFGESLKESYRYMDEIIGEVLDRWQGKANILIVSDHGFGSATGRFKGRNPELNGNHRSVGIMMAAGPDFAPGEIKGMTIMEVAPTLAALLGLPVSDEWPGRVETSLLRESFFADHPLETVRNYQHIEVAQGEVGTDQAAEQQNMSSLRGLGYVGEGVELAADADAGEYDFWTAERRLIVREIMMEVVYYLLSGDLDAANESFALLASNRPDLIKIELQSIQFKFDELSSLLPEGDVDVAAFNQFLSQHGKGQ